MSLPTRILLPHEYPEYASHLKSLSPDDRYSRFRSVTNNLTIDAFVQKIQDNPREIVLAHYGDILQIDGSLQLSLIEDTHQGVRRRIAELSMSVLPESRGRGIADALTEHAILHARSLRVEQLITTCHPSNKAMIHIARRIGMEVAGDSDEKNAELILPKAGMETVSLDIFRQQLGTADYITRMTVHSVGRILQTFLTDTTPGEGTYIAK